MRLAAYYHAKFGGKYDLQDLFLAARQGIVDAHESYDPKNKRKASFFTHAHNCSRFRIHRYLREDTGVIKIPSKVPKNARIPAVVELPIGWEKSPTKFDGFDDIDRKMVLAQAVQSLTPMQQKIMRCIYVEEMSTREAARHLKVAVNTVYAHLRSGQARLAELLAEQDVDGWKDL